MKTLSIILVTLVFTGIAQGEEKNNRFHLERIIVEDQGGPNETFNTCVINDAGVHETVTMNGLSYTKSARVPHFTKEKISYRVIDSDKLDLSSINQNGVKRYVKFVARANPYAETKDLRFAYIDYYDRTRVHQAYGQEARDLIRLTNRLCGYTPKL